MAYDEGLAERVRGVLDERLDVSEKRMFGGIAFMVRGHMCVGIVKDELMVRVGPDRYDGLVRQPNARRMDFTGRPMKGFVFVDAAGLETDAGLSRWVEHGLRYVSSLPAKGAPPARRSPASLPARGSSRTAGTGRAGARRRAGR
jgi:TfoX/Sxy family transcriptional regulator of competence genes